MQKLNFGLIEIWLQFKAADFILFIKVLKNGSILKKNTNLALFSGYFKP